MHTLLYVDDLLNVCISFDEITRARQIIEDMLLVVGIVHAPLKGCFDAPTQTLPDHLVFIISSFNWQMPSASAREEMLCAVQTGARAAFRSSQESTSRRFRPLVSLRGSSDILLASCTVGAHSSTRGLQCSRAVQTTVLPHSRSNRQIFYFDATSPSTQRKIFKSCGRRKPPSRSTLTHREGQAGTRYWNRPTSQRDRVQAGRFHKKCWRSSHSRSLESSQGVPSRFARERRHPVR